MSLNLQVANPLLAEHWIEIACALTKATVSQCALEHVQGQRMEWVSYAVVAAVMFGIGGVGAKATDIGPWYRNLKKPSWNPPDWAFPVVWTTIYLFIIASVGRVWNLSDTDYRLTIFVLVAINLVLNMLWSVLFFGLKKPVWALVEVAALWLSIVAMIIGFQQVDSLSAGLLLPYLIWVSVASFLNLTIIRLNPNVRSSYSPAAGS